MQLLGEFLENTRPQVRLAAATWSACEAIPEHVSWLISCSLSITNLHKAVDSEPELHFTPSLRFLPPEIVRSTIVTLLRLLSRPDRDATHAAFTLGECMTLSGTEEEVTVSVAQLHFVCVAPLEAYLVSDDNHLQAVARNLGAFTKLEGVLKMSLTTKNPYLTREQIDARSALRQARGSAPLARMVPLLTRSVFTQACLLAAASLALTNEKNRKGLVDADLLGHVVGLLSDEDLSVRVAACQCARALSRSVGVLRTHLIEAGSAEPLCSMLEDDDDVAV